MPSSQRFELSAPLLSLVVLIGAPQPARAAMYSPTLGYLKIVHLTLCLIPSCDSHPQPSKWTLECT